MVRNSTCKYFSSKMRKKLALLIFHPWTDPGILAGLCVSAAMAP